MKGFGGFLRRLLLENWGAKTVSLFLATLLWMYVVGEKRSEMSLSVPLELTGVPATLVIVNRVPETVRVRLSGPRTLLAAINPQQLSVALDLAAIQPGTTTFENLPARLELPKRIEVTYVSPSVITLEADLKARKRLPVRLRVRGEPGEGFRIAESHVDPPEVELEGSARVLRVLRDVPTEVLDLAGVEETQTRSVALSLPDPTLRQLTKGPIVAQISVAEQSGVRDFHRIPVELPGRRWVAAPATVAVRVAGGTATLGRLGGADVSAEVEGSGRAMTSGSHRVVVRAPEGVEVISVRPRVVVVRLRRGPEAFLDTAPETDEPTATGE